MLNDQEQRSWDDVQRFWAETGDEPVRRGHPERAHGDVPGWVRAGFAVALFLVLFGVVGPGLAFGAATALGWGWWHVRQHLRTPDADRDTLPAPGKGP